MAAKHDPADGPGQAPPKDEGDAESVFTDSEDEEGELPVGRREVASDAEDDEEATAGPRPVAQAGGASP